MLAYYGNLNALNPFTAPHSPPLMSFSFFLARRFFGYRDDQRRRKASTPAIHIATLGVALGLAVALISYAVVRGFQHEIQSKLTGFAAHAEVVDLRSFASPESYPLTVTDDVRQQIQKQSTALSAWRYAQKIGVLKTEADFQAVALKGVSPEYDLGFIRSCIVSGQLPEGSSWGQKIVISQQVANALGLHVGDKVFAYFFEQTVKMRRFEIAAIYQTRLKQFDSTFALADMKTVQQLNSWTESQCSGVELRWKDMAAGDAAMPRARQAAMLASLPAPQNDTAQVTFGPPQPTALSLRENPRTAGTMNWLDLLDTNVWVILVLVLLVAAFSMVSGLLILILERTQTIGVLKALGATDAALRRTFLYYAAFIAVRGLAIGNGLALALIFAQQQWGFAKLDPETYYIDRVPTDLSWIAFALINIAALVLVLLALLLPARAVGRVAPAKAIRFE